MQPRLERWRARFCPVVRINPATTTEMIPVNGNHADDVFEQHVASHRGIVRKIAATYRQTADDRASLAVLNYRS